MKNGKFYFAALMSFIFLLGCKTEKETLIGTKDCYLQFVRTNGNISSEFIYNEKKQVEFIKLDNFGEVELNSYIERVYNDLDRLDSINYYDEKGDLKSIFEYTYFGNDSIKVNYYFNPELPFAFDNFDKYEELMVLHFDNSKNCKLQAQYYYEGYTDTLQYVEKFEYLDENCSYLATKYTEDGNQIVSTKKVVFDDKIGPYYIMSAPGFEDFNKHNKVENYSSGHPSESYTSTFEYNEYGYPTKEVRVNRQGKTTEYTFEYLCE